MSAIYASDPTHDLSAFPADCEREITADEVAQAAGDIFCGADLATLWNMDVGADVVAGGRYVGNVNGTMYFTAGYQRSAVARWRESYNAPSYYSAW